MNRFVLMAAGLIATGSPAATSLQAQSKAAPTLDWIDLVESAGVKLPKGEELARLVSDAERHPLGSRLNPVRTDPAGGQKEYLARLRCADARRPAFKRVFSAGIGPFGRIIDEYSLRCSDKTESVYLDMYHRGFVEARPIPGYSIRMPD